MVVPEREGKGLREREDKMGRECGGLYIIYLSILVVRLSHYMQAHGGIMRRPLT